MNQRIITKLEEALSHGTFTHAELLVARAGKTVLHEHTGDFPRAEKSFFDLASLTKPLCTALLMALLVQEGKLGLDATVAEFFPTTNLKDITLRRLLNHTSGLVDWFPFYRQLQADKDVDYDKNKKLVAERILTDPTLVTNFHHAVYSDLGYILLGIILENVTKTRLDRLYQQGLTEPLSISDRIFFVPQDQPGHHDMSSFIPAEDSRLRKKIIQGEVMDDNCWAMGGLGGHAGLFANAGAVHEILCELRRASLGQSKLFSQTVFDQFCRPDPQRPRDTHSFTLGFDTPTKGKSQSGTLFSPNSIGHLGFSGTSFWWDLDKDLWIILLTNRCMPDRKNNKIKHFRPELHDLIVKELFPA